VHGRTLKLGFIGLGQATNKVMARLDEIRTLPYRITDACDLRPHALDAFQKQFGGRTFQDVEEMCAKSDVDVVYIATPAEFHRTHVEIAASHGKHIVVEKPIALSIEDCQAMIAVTETHGVKLLAGHTHSFDAPMRKMREIIKSGAIGDVVMINSWNYNEFNHRSRLTAELQTTRGPIFNQGPHQVDLVRQLGGGMVKSVKAKAIRDSLSDCEGGYSCFLEFDNGAPATLVYDGRSFFDTAELFWWVNEGGSPRPPDTNARRRKSYRRFASLSSQEKEENLAREKEAGRYGAENARPIYEHTGPDNHQPFFGLTVVSCDRGAMRQSQDGLIIYGEEGPQEIQLARELHGRAAELKELYEGVTGNRPIFHDGRWAMATLEVCMAIADSVGESREIRLRHQVPIGD
jgi:phthalate 4,5-cis-dihydrodiol dehydrogenase